MKGTPARTRPYRMKARAEAAGRTAERILEATVGLYSERFADQVTLEAIAGRAGVTVQTVLRRFGTKDDLLTAAAQWTHDRVMDQRSQAPVGDIAGAVDNLVTHYAETGEGVLRLLAQEGTVPQFGPILQMGREGHYRWVQETFRPYLDTSGHPSRLRAALIAATDIYVWKVLHLDLGMEGDELRDTLTGMLTALTEKETA